jgi:glycine/D-amino acid oxidase-like deaminating enzyme
VAGAALVAAIFVPRELHSHPAAIVHGTQQAFLALGVLTILSSVVFMELKADDGEGMSNHDASHHRPDEH